MFVFSFISIFDGKPRHKPFSHVPEGGREDTCDHGWHRKNSCATWTRNIKVMRKYIYLQYIEGIARFDRRGMLVSGPKLITAADVLYNQITVQP